MARTAMGRPDDLRADAERLRADAKAGERLAAAIEAALPSAEAYWALADARRRARDREKVSYHRRAKGARTDKG